MYSNKAKDHHHIAKLVRAFVSPSTPRAGLEDVARALREAVRSPNDIISCETIPDSHFLKIEALAVRDAFEAATNGMTAPDAFQALARIPADSVFAPWKSLVAAVISFYSGDSAGLRRSLGEIPEGSFPRHSVGLWRDIAQRQGPPEPMSALGRAASDPDPFLDKLFPESDSLTVLADEISEAIAEGMMDLCMVACSRLLKELRSRSETAARQAALLILRELDGKGASVDEFLRIIQACFGEAESLRLTALYLSDSRPLLALLFWVKAGAAFIEADPREAELAAWCAVLDRAVRAASAALEEDPAPRREFLAALDPAADRFARLALGIQPALAWPARADALSRLAGAASRYAERPAGKPKAAAPGRKKRAKPQLELFA